MTFALELNFSIPVEKTQTSNRQRYKIVQVQASCRDKQLARNQSGEKRRLLKNADLKYYEQKYKFAKYEHSI